MNNEKKISVLYKQRRKADQWLPGAQGGEKTVNRHKGTLGDDGNVLKLDCGDCCTTG